MAIAVEQSSKSTFNNLDKYLNGVAVERTIWIVLAPLCWIGYIYNAGYLFGDKTPVMLRRSHSIQKEYH